SRPGKCNTAIRAAREKAIGQDDGHWREKETGHHCPGWSKKPGSEAVHLLFEDEFIGRIPADEDLFTGREAGLLTRAFHDDNIAATGARFHMDAVAEER